MSDKQVERIFRDAAKAMHKGRGPRSTTSKHCTRQPCPTPYDCGAGCCSTAHDRAAHAFCTAEADELDEFAAGNARWIEPKQLWPVWVLGAFLAVAYGMACHF